MLRISGAKIKFNRKESQPFANTQCARMMCVWAAPRVPPGLSFPLASLQVLSGHRYLIKGRIPWEGELASDHLLYEIAAFQNIREMVLLRASISESYKWDLIYNEVYHMCDILAAKVVCKMKCSIPRFLFQNWPVNLPSRTMTMYNRSDIIRKNPEICGSSKWQWAASPRWLEKYLETA